MIKIALINFFLFGLTSNLCFASDHQNYELSFSNQEANGLPIISNEVNFDCSDQIYTVINASNLDDKSVKAMIIWRKPSGEIQEQTPVNLYPVEGKALGWAWLKLHKATGAALFSFVDGSIGMDEFIGDWQIELRINDEKAARASFNVLC